MFVKIATIAFTAAFIATTIATDEVWNGLVASSDINTSTHYHKLPRTYEDAENEGWTNITGVNAPEWITSLAFEGDPTFVLLFHEGKVIGCQMAIRVADVQNLTQPLQWDEVTITTKTFNDELFYALTVYFYQNNVENIRRIWLQEKKDFHEIPTNVSLLSSDTNFTMKNCVPTIGTYYDQMNSTTDCATMNPWVLLAEDYHIIGFGIRGVGKPTTLGNRKWWQTISRDELYAANSDPPRCACDAADEFGMFTLHVWFVEGPQNITCSYN